MKKKIIMTIAILAFWSVYYFQNYYNQHPDSAIKEESTKVAPKAPMPVDDIQLKKLRFFNSLRPAIQKENARIADERHYLIDIKKQLEEGKLATSPSSKIKKLAKDYDFAIPEKGIDEDWLKIMLNRVNVLPTSLVLIQAANESAWGTSRFAQEGNNFFGQWCYVDGCGLVPLNRVEGASHEVAKFDSPQQSVHAYFMNVNRNSAYKALRDIRSKLAEQDQNLQSEKTALELTNGLLNYSERGQAYVNDLQTMIKHNSEFWRENDA